MGWFFSRAALVTFGGADAVLAYVNVAAVARFGWLLPGQMVVGLGLAETTPGPLIMVLEFVGFVGAYRNPGGLSPLVAGTIGAVVATWATFAPCFLWIFLGAPYIERLRGNRRHFPGAPLVHARRLRARRRGGRVRRALAVPMEDHPGRRGERLRRVGGERVHPWLRSGRRTMSEDVTRERAKMDRSAIDRRR
jgi:hypothetical protein